MLGEDYEKMKGRSWSSKKENKLVMVDNVFATITCSLAECGKRRIVYLEKDSDKALAQQVLQKMEEDCHYVCGEELPFLEGLEQWASPVTSRMAVRVKLDCTVPMERWFYDKIISGVSHPEKVCSWCGGVHGVQAEQGDEDYPQGWRHILPRCEECKEQGLCWITWGQGGVKAKAATLRKRKKRGKGKSKKKGKGVDDTSSEEEEDEGDEGKADDEDGDEGSSSGGQKPMRKSKRSRIIMHGASSEEDDGKEVDDDDMGGEEKEGDKEDRTDDARRSSVGGKGVEKEASAVASDYWYCKKELADGMIECAMCNEWYHFTCIGRKEGKDREEKAIACAEKDDWVCGVCEKKPHQE